MGNKIKNFLRNTNPIFLIIVVILLVENLIARSNGNIAGKLYEMLLYLPGIIIAISFHEAGHAYASYFLGDPTPKFQNRLTLNPASHIDPLGLIALFFAGFGWGKPVQIDPRYYKNKRRDEFIVSIAGVTVNFVVALLMSLLLAAMFKYDNEFVFSAVGQVFVEVFINVVNINVVLMIFNLIPIPPLDGFGIATQIFNLEKYDWYYKVYQLGPFILMTLIILNVTQYIVGPIYSAVIRLFSYIIYM